MLVQGERAPEFVREAEADDGEDLVQPLQDAARDARFLMLQTPDQVRKSRSGVGQTKWIDAQTGIHSFGQMRNPFRYFNSSPGVIRLAVMMYVRYPLSLRQVGICCSSAVSTSAMRRYRWNRFGPLFAGEIRRRRVGRRNWSNWRWHLEEVFVRINGENITCGENGGAIIPQ